jgi:hypothetical protein
MRHTPRRIGMIAWKSHALRPGVIVVMSLLGIASMGYASGSPDRVPGYGTGMMGGAAPGRTAGGTYGQGMMGGGMMGGGMMGGGYSGLDNSLQRTVDIKKAGSIVAEYLAGQPNKNLVIDEIMEFENNLYILIKEKDSGKGAFELLVDPFTGALQPEFGPNMMWNIKYGMMGGTGAAVRPNSIGMEEAKKLASEYLDRARGKGPYELGADEFYGYYTLDVKKDGTVLGMLSVNAFTGQVWYHTWHGGYIGMQEGMGGM